MLIHFEKNKSNVSECCGNVLVAISLGFSAKAKTFLVHFERFMELPALMTDVSNAAERVGNL